MPFIRRGADLVLVVATKRETDTTIVATAADIEDDLRIESDMTSSIAAYLRIYDAADRKWDEFARRYQLVRGKLLQRSLPAVAAMDQLYFDATGDFLFGRPSQKRNIRAP